MSTKLSIVIAHAERSTDRRASLKKMLTQLEACGFCVGGDGQWNHRDGHRLVVETTVGEPCVWSEAQWKASLDGNGFSHCVCLNDDLILCEDFLGQAVAAVEAQPGAVINFYNVSRISEQVYNGGLRWVTTVDGLVGNAYSLPVETMKDFLVWRDKYMLPGNKQKLSEDQQINLYVMANFGLVWHTVPALVDHDTSIPSLFGNKQLRKPVVGPQKEMPTNWKTEGAHAGRVFNGNHKMVITALDRNLVKEKNLVDRYYRLDAEPTGA